MRRSATSLPVLMLLMLCLFVGTPLLRGQMQAVGDGGPGPFKAQHLTVELTSNAQAILAGWNCASGLGSDA